MVRFIKIVVTKKEFDTECPNFILDYLQGVLTLKQAHNAQKSSVFSAQIFINKNCKEITKICEKFIAHISPGKV